MKEDKDYGKIIKLSLALQIITTCLMIYIAAITLTRNSQYQNVMDRYIQMMKKYEEETSKYDQRVQQYDEEMRKYKERINQ